MNSTTTNADCINAEQAVINLWYNLVRIIEILTGLTTFILLGILIISYRRNPVPLHANLKIFLVNSLFLFALNSYHFCTLQGRSLYIFFTYQEPCECLNPVWLVFILRLPAYIFLMTSPVVHFAIMAERVRATIFAKGYEREGKKFGICGTIIIVTSFCVALVLSALADTGTFGKPLVYMTMTSKYNNDPMVYMHVFFLILVISIAIADYQLIRINRRNRQNRISDIAAGYDLSRYYQVNENMLTMRLIFPLDFSYVVSMIAFILLSAVFRLLLASIGRLMFTIAYELITVILEVQGIITISVYLYYIYASKRIRNSTTKTEPRMDQHTDIYFDHYKEIWHTK